MLPTFDEFMNAQLTGRRYRQSNSYVRFAGFESLYVRVNRRYLNGRIVEKVIDIANCTVLEQRKGTFKNLINHIRTAYPEYTIYVECVLNTPFCAGLERMGFIRIETIPPSYYLKAKGI